MLIVWAPLWANVPWTTYSWNPCFERNKFHICMHTIHGILMLSCSHAWFKVCSCVHLYTLWTKGSPCKIWITCLFGLGKVLTPMDPIEYGYQNPLLFLFDVGVGSHLTWEYRCLDGGCFCAWWTLLWMHHLQESFVGGPPWFGDLEISPNGFGNYLSHLVYMLLLMILACFGVLWLLC